MQLGFSHISFHPHYKSAYAVDRVAHFSSEFFNAIKTIS